MESFQILVLLLCAAAILVGISQKLGIPYPIALVLGGAALGFMPKLQAIVFDPNLILLIALPPILYYAAFGISFREFKKNWRPIFSLALGLVFVTTLVIGVVFKWMFPEFSWALAFAFGAIVSPPDAVAATTILKRFEIGPKLLTILEGESLVNDASALVLYKMAVVAILSGAFSIADASLEFVKIVSGGIAVGLILGFLIQLFSKHSLAPVVGVVFSFTIPYVTYIVADYLGFSGVLAVVVVGLIGSQMLLTHQSSLRRILGFAVWDIFNIFMNCFVFILIGLQLRSFTQVISTSQMFVYIGYAFVIAFAMIIVRIAWVFAKSGMAYLKALGQSHAATICPEIKRDAILIGWAGMRGIVSLTAALALPFYLPDGTLLEGRNEVVFITFCVILITLLVPGFTLAPLTRYLKIQYQPEHITGHRVRKQLVKLADEKLSHLHAANSISEDDYKFLKTYFYLQRRVFEMAVPTHKKLEKLEMIRQRIIQEQRKHLLDLWKNGEIDDRVLSQLEQQLDFEESRIARAELN